MDERLQKALDFSNYMVTLNNQKRILQETVYQDLVYYTNGSKFTIDKELICFCSTMINLNRETIVLIDDNDIPVRIESIGDFLTDILDVYFTATNKFYTEYQKLKNSRSVEKLIDL